jgi:hypothetical protein
LNGCLHQGAHNLIEGGHTVVDCSDNAELCVCGQYGCAEVYASANNTYKRMCQMDKLNNVNKFDNNINNSGGTTHFEGGAKEVFDRASDGDENAQIVLNKVSICCFLCIRLLGQFTVYVHVPCKLYTHGHVYIYHISSLFTEWLYLL